MRTLIAFLRMRHEPVNRLDVAWAYAWPILTALGIALAWVLAS